MADQTLTDLAAEYRTNAGVLGSSAAESEKLAARGYRPGYHGGYAKVCRREAADWAALAGLAEFAAMAAPRWEGAEARLVTAVRRLAAHLEAPHA